MFDPSTKAVRPFICSRDPVVPQIASDLVKEWQGSSPNLPSVTGMLKHLRAFGAVSLGLLSQGRKVELQQSSSKNEIFLRDV